MNPVVHFEMPFDDKARLTRFYEQAFGWQMQPHRRGDMGDYVLATTTPSGSDGRPTGVGRDQRRLLPEEARLAGAGALGRDRRRRHQGGDGQGEGRRRRGARRADGDSGRRPVRVVHRQRRQPRQHPAAAAARMIARKVREAGAASEQADHDPRHACDVLFVRGRGAARLPPRQARPEGQRRRRRLADLRRARGRSRRASRPKAASPPPARPTSRSTATTSPRPSPS